MGFVSTRYLNKRKLLKLGKPKVLPGFKWLLLLIMDKFPFLKEYTRRNDEVFARNSKREKKDQKLQDKYQWDGECYEHFIKDSFFENPWKKFAWFIIIYNESTLIKSKGLTIDRYS